MSKPRIILYVIIALAAGVIGWGISQMSQPAALSFVKAGMEDDLEAYSVEVSYPETDNENLNREISSYIESGLAQFKEIAQENWQVFSPEARRGMRGVFITEYEIFSNREVVSMKFQNYQFTGGAHGNTYFKTFAYDLENERNLALEDFFQEDSDYLDRISEITRAELFDKFENEFEGAARGIENMLNLGTEAREENFENFTLGAEGMTFFFPPYQVAPYAAGPQEVLVSWEELDGILKFDPQRLDIRS